MNLMKILATKNYCYTDLGNMSSIKGIMVHSTGCNNPNLRRYVAPDNGKIGTPSSAHWNQRTINGSVQKLGVHAFIGKLKDGSIATVQVQEWNHKCYHCGVGKSGKSGNTNYISFEICEDNLKDADYFNKVYNEAVELCAYLCEKYDLDPIKNIVCHSEGYKLGFASNHADVMHWFKLYNKTMDQFRSDVEEVLLMNTLSYDKWKEYMTKYEAEKAAAEMPITSGLYPEFEEARKAGITDGSAPYGYATRAQVAVMTLRATKK